MEHAKEGSRQILAGGSAGLVEVLIMHPLDLIKTRLQIDQSNRGMADCVRSTLRDEGIRGFYKGILPPILAETPKRATKFFTFEQYKHIFSTPGISPAITLSLAGLCSGMTEAVVVCPFETVKVRLQSMKNANPKEVPTSMELAREIIRAEGMGTKGIFRGLTSTVARNGTWNMVYFGLYHNVKVYIPDAKESASLNLTYRILLGFIAGSLASVVNIPFDVAKSRIQGPQPIPGSRKYHGCLQSMGLVYKEEGFFALYKGLLPKIMRLGPGGAIMLVVYDEVYKYLKQFG
ncbi:unnamed protein product, partial [Mesorhabditis belari]|uniref:Mitochondrial 2-oxodicarboxylate carrier n=1 Tax=Mesorhabditis belari TaxID=2138241 RepID=A0AAF3FM06_9BILA